MKKSTANGGKKYLTKVKTPQNMSGGKFIAETFKAYGVTHVFFVEAIVRKALVEMEVLGIHRVLAHSEKAAAYMADGYARVCRRPGVCMAQSVGAANLAAGLQDAFQALSPVIAITGRKPPIAQYRNAYQEIYHYPLFEPVTKYNVNVDTIEQLPYLLRQAFREATSGKPRPVHLDLMGNLGQITTDAETGTDVVVEASFKSFPAYRTPPDNEHIAAAARMLEKSARPVIVAGGGAMASSAGPEVTRLAEMLSIPVATSLAGKGAILENHPLSVGVVGSYSRWCANQVVYNADLVLYVGSQTGDQVTNYWKIPKPGTNVIQIDIDPAEIGRSYPNVVGIVGDAKVSLVELMKVVKAKSPKGTWAQKAKKLVDKWRNELKPIWKLDTPPIRTERLCKELTEVLPANSILVADTGYSGIWTGAMVDITHRNQRYLRAAGSLGWAFPASLGAKCAAPDRPVICFTGDGGLWYHLTELETAVRCGINTITVVNNNSGFGQCLPNVNTAYGDRPGNRRELCTFSQFNFAKFAQDMGCLGITVENPGDISSAIKTALKAKVPAMINVITDIEHGAPDPWTP